MISYRFRFVEIAAGDRDHLLEGVRFFPADLADVRRFFRFCSAVIREICETLSLAFVKRNSNF
jgi:hypothetical protein